MGSLAGKWQRVIGICKWHGQTGCFNNQDLKRKSLIWWRGRNRLPREPITGARGWMLSLAGAPQSGGREAGTLGGCASASKMPSDLVTQPCLFPDANSWELFLLNTSCCRPLSSPGPPPLFFWTSASQMGSTNSLLTAPGELIPPTPNLSSTESSQSLLCNYLGSHEPRLKAPLGPPVYKPGAHASLPCRDPAPFMLTSSHRNLLP